VQIPPHARDAPNLKKLLADPGVLKIFHFARFDLAMLYHAFGVMPEPVYCTKIASRLSRTYTDKHGLKDLVREVLGHEISKQQQSSDWGAAELSDAQISYAKLPGFPPVGVSGHAGHLLVGFLGGTPVMVLSGRAHFYEGHPMERVTFAVRALAAYGIRDLLLTNAAGGLNRKFRAGDFMMLTDHINLMGVNPLRGEAIPGLPRFVDLTQAYDAGLRRLLRTAAKECKVKLQGGVYLAVSGPSYETPAEIRAFARLGADAVGMSTVPEAIVARQCGVNVAAVSCITNLAAGISKGNLSHAEVLETARPLFLKRIEQALRKTARLAKTEAVN